MKIRNWKTALAGAAALTLLVGTMTIPTLASSGWKTATLEYQDLKVTLDGKQLDLRGGDGNPVEPFIIDGTTYLPVAAISRALGMEVTWDNNTKTVVITSGSGSSTSVVTPSDGSYIGEAKAKEIALNHAGLTSGQVTFYKALMDWENGRAVYEVEFYSGNKEYDYEIDASTGTIVSFDYDIEGYAPSTNTSTSQGDIGSEKAKEIALNHAGVSASQAVFVYAQPDYENGRKVYEVEFYSGSTEYDYEIDAATGSIVSYDYDAERYAPQQTTGDYIGETKAKSIVEAKAGATGTYREFRLERDDGRMVYEGELRVGRTDYEFKIDAVSGTVLEWDVDWD